MKTNSNFNKIERDLLSNGTLGVEYTLLSPKEKIEFENYFLEKYNYDKYYVTLLDKSIEVEDSYILSEEDWLYALSSIIRVIVFSVIAFLWGTPEGLKEGIKLLLVIAIILFIFNGAIKSISKFISLYLKRI